MTHILAQTLIQSGIPAPWLLLGAGAGALLICSVLRPRGESEDSTPWEDL